MAVYTLIYVDTAEKDEVVGIDTTELCLLSSTVHLTPYQI